MTVQLNEKEREIELYRKNGFNGFPIPKGQKGADTRYRKDGMTVTNQIIKEDENWGVHGTKEDKNGTVDLDDKESFRPFAVKLISKGCKVIETPNGWHIPFINAGNVFEKTNLWNKNINPDKQCVEIMTYKTYVIGVDSWVREDKKDPQSKLVTYKNVGSDKFWDLKGMMSGDFIDYICKECNVENPNEKTNSSQNQKLRLAFTNRKPPTGNSNNYFLESARVCYWTEKLDRDEAYNEIKKVYDLWKASEYYSHRSWDNVKVKIDTVYDNPKQWEIRSGKKFGDSKNEIDRTGIALKILKEREFFSDKVLGQVYENKNGFLELVNDVLPSELFTMNPKIETADIREIISKIKLGANDMPLTNKNLIVFKNGIIDIRLGKMIETMEIADMGFNQYNYLEKIKANEPKEFLKFLKSYPKNDIPRLKAGLRSIFNGYLDSRITVIHGISRVGKTTMMNIVCKILGSEYAFSVDLEEFLDDRATRSLIIGKRLIVFQDLPETWKKFTIIKNITGESQSGIRKFGERLDGNSPNQIKIFSTANQLPSIKDSQKNAMYSARLSLIHNIETKPFKENPMLEDDIFEKEGEKILSWIINLTDEECQYEDSKIVKEEWEALANPQMNWIDKEYVVDGDTSNTIPVISLCDKFKEDSDHNMKVSLEAMSLSLKELGYTVRDNICKYISVKPKAVHI